MSTARAKFKRNRDQQLVIDASLLGQEPAELGIDFVPTSSSLTRAYNWYSYYYEVRDIKKWVVEYMQNHPDVFKKDQIRIYNRSYIYATTVNMCANARMLLSGCPMPTGTEEKLQRRLFEIISKTDAAKQVVEEPNNTIRAATLVIADIESEFDKFFAKYKFFKPDVYAILQHYHAKPSDARTLMNYYQPLRDEVQLGGEGYERLSRRQKKSYLQFIDSVLESARVYSSNEKAQKKRNKRPRRPRPAQQLVQKLNYCKEFPALNLVSIDPTEIVHARVAYTYNVKRRLLGMIVAPELKSLTVSRSTIQNFDPALSGYKRLRKPEDFLPGFVAANKAGMQKKFKELKTASRKASGRINNDMVIIRAFK